MSVLSKLGLKGYSLLYLLIVAIITAYAKVFISRNIRVLKGLPYIRFSRGISWHKAKGFTAGKGLRFELENSGAKLELGRNLKVNDFVHVGVWDKVSIGENCLFGSRVTIIDHDHGVYNGKGTHSNPGSSPDSRELSGRGICIGDNVWLGDGVVVLPGAEIGHGVIIGANSVVKGVIPNNSIVAGCPAKVLKMFNPESDCWEKL